MTSSRTAGPAGRCRVSGTQHEAELFGRRDVVAADLFDEASDAVEVVRRLWDSWEDDAVIRDVATGRFVDRDKLHYIDFTGKYFSVKGPSITPRPPQGQPVVAALAHALPVYEFASRSVDLVFITPQDDDSLQAILGEVAQAGGTDLKVYADVFVSFSGTTDPRSDALVFDGTPTELVDLLVRWQRLGIDGVRLRPAVNATDLPVIVDEVVPLLQRAGLFRTAYRDGETLRERLGLPVADNRYARVEHVMTVPLSILDLAPISEGCDAATALRNTVDLAQHAEQWGYRRYWIAEHHFVAVASSSPAVLIGQIAAATDRIRVGAAAVQLGHTTAVAVVESFGMLDAFYPGRIDLGVGRSGQRRREAVKKASSKPKPKPPSGMARRRRRDRPAAVRRASASSPIRLRAQMSVLQQPEAVAPDFADQVDDILAMLRRQLPSRRRRRARRARRTNRPDAVGLRQQQGAERTGGRRPRAAVRGQLPHHPGHRARRDRRLPRRVHAVGRAVRAVRGGVGRRGGGRRHRHRAASGVQLRPLGVLDSRRRRRHPVPGSRQRASR